MQSYTRHDIMSYPPARQTGVSCLIGFVFDSIGGLVCMKGLPSYPVMSEKVSVKAIT